MSSTVEGQIEEINKEELFHFDHHHVDYEGGKLGMWLFLFTELVLFGGMFLALFVYGTGEYAADFHAAGKSLNIFKGAGNTLVLLTSSLTMVYAITALQRGSKFWALTHIAITVILALTFMVVKYFEWTSKFEHHLFPSKIAFLKSIYGPSDLKNAYTKEWKESGLTIAEFNAVKVDAKGNPAPAGLTAEQAKDYTHTRYTRGQVIFYGMYFTMTGLHGFHVMIGVALLLWMFVCVLKNTVTAENFGWLENVGLYWHLVDLIWIYLFPLFYLVA